MTRSCRLRFGLAVSWKSLHGNSAGDDITVWHVLWIDNFREKAQRRDGKASVWGESTGGKKQWDRFTVQHVLHRDAWNEHATHATTHPDAVYLPADGSMWVCVCDEQVPFACPYACWCHLTSDGSSDMDHMFLWRPTRRYIIRLFNWQYCQNFNSYLCFLQHLRHFY